MTWWQGVAANREIQKSEHDSLYCRLSKSCNLDIILPLLAPWKEWWYYYGIPYNLQFSRFL
nr:hypothetical protein [Zobellia laminariae]